MYITSDNEIFMGNIHGHEISEIPAGNWMVKIDPKLGYYLEKTADFMLPPKIYGDVDHLIKRYLNSFNSWNTNLGILLSGLKGTGKSLLAKKLCIDSKMPVIMINEGHSGTEFILFLNKINQNCVIFMDEFEKVYREEEHQNALLNILDGSFNSKFLFVLTINEYHRMTQYMINRPGRIHYFKQYGGLDENTIEAICKDKLDDFSKYPDVNKVCNCIGEITMDILTSLIKEVNLYPDDNPVKVLDYMNLSPSSDIKYKADIYQDNNLIYKDLFYDNGNPLVAKNVNLEWYDVHARSKYDDEESDSAELPQSPQLVSCIGNDGKCWNYLTIEIENSVMKVTKDYIVIEYKEMLNNGNTINWRIKFTKRPSYVNNYSKFMI